MKSDRRKAGSWFAVSLVAIGMLLLIPSLAQASGLIRSAGMGSAAPLDLSSLLPGRAAGEPLEVSKIGRAHV